MSIKAAILTLKPHEHRFLTVTPSGRPVCEDCGFEDDGDELTENRDLALVESIDDEIDPGQRGACSRHVWVYTGSAYGGDDESYHGEGRVYCENCGADGDA